MAFHLLAQPHLEADERPALTVIVSGGVQPRFCHGTAAEPSRDGASNIILDIALSRARKPMNRLITAFILMFVSIIDVSAQTLPIPSYWKTGRGAEMKLFSLSPDGTFTGIYISHAADFQCQNTPYDLVGRVIGNEVRFSVVWTNWAADCKSQTVWEGRIAGTTILARGLYTAHNDNGTVKKCAAPTFFNNSSSASPASGRRFCRPNCPRRGPRACRQQPMNPRAQMLCR